MCSCQKMEETNDANLAKYFEKKELRLIHKRYGGSPEYFEIEILFSKSKDLAGDNNIIIILSFFDFQ